MFFRLFSASVRSRPPGPPAVPGVFHNQTGKFWTHMFHYNEQNLGFFSQYCQIKAEVCLLDLHSKTVSVLGTRQGYNRDLQYLLVFVFILLHGDRMDLSIRNIVFQIHSFVKQILKYFQNR